MNDLAVFTLAAFTLLAAPGPTNALLPAAGADGLSREGVLRRAAVLTATVFFAYALALTIWLAIAAFSAEIGWLMAALKIAATALLVYLAIKLWRRGLQPAAGVSVNPQGLFLATALNPKALVVALALLPRWPVTHLITHLVIFAALVVLVSACWLGLGRLAAHAAGPRATPRRVSRLAAATLVFFAGLIGFQAFTG